MATEGYVTYWVTVERGDGPEWERVDHYPMIYPAGHANALAASASDLRHVGLDPAIPIRVMVWETAAAGMRFEDVMSGDPSAMWIRASILTVDDARRILAGVHVTDVDDIAWREWAAAEQAAVVADVLGEEQRRNRAAAEEEAYRDAVDLSAEVAERAIHCPVPILVRGMTRECGNPLPCLRHPKTEQD
jgi:hypothetical protein